jgi:copper chaperone CopZ
LASCMKRTIVASLAALVLGAGSVLADASLTLEGVHNCCGGCERGITKAVESVKGATVTVDGETVTISAKNSTTVKKAVAALFDGGYAGKGEGVETPKAASSDRKLNGATVTGVHLCCGKCVRAVEAAVKTVPGITGSSIESKATQFTVEGEFTEGVLIAALNAAGFNGSIK